MILPSLLIVPINYRVLFVAENFKAEMCAASRLIIIWTLS